MEVVDVVVIGAGVVGLSVAYELAKSGVRNIAILEREALPGMGSTSSCTGGIRLQFSSGANIVFSKFGLERFASFRDEFGVDIELRRNGYLFLITRQDRIPLYAEGHRLQRSLGVEVSFVDRNWIGKIAPFLRLEDIISGSFCPLEAHADPHKVVGAYLRGLRNFGVRVHTGREVTGIELEKGHAAKVLTGMGPVSAGAVVNCAGPYAGRIARMVGLELPVVSRKRHVLAVKPPVNVGRDLPLIVDDDTGWYMKSEPGGIALMGGTDREGEPSFETAPDPGAVERIIEAGLRRVPAFEDAGIVKTIVGLRCMSPDDHAIIGRVPGTESFYCAVGFSGHGFMHAPATGAGMAELITGGRSSSFDLSPFDPDRFSGRTPVVEPERYVF